MVTISLPGDVTAVRDVPRSSVRIQMQPFHEGDEIVTLHFDIHAALSRPDPKIPTSVSFTGRADATLCPSAIALGRSAPVDPEGPVRITIGERTFVAASVLAFLSENGENSPQIDAISFYEEADATCDAATRSIADDGGGVNGLQVMTGPVAASVNLSVLGSAHPIVARVFDNTVGYTSFGQKIVTEQLLPGFVHLGSAELTDEGGSLYGAIHAETPPSETLAHAAIEGVFAAKVCKRSW
jgi:hypothetical protein